RSTRFDMSSLTKLPPISTTRILLLMSARRCERATLSAPPEQSPHAALRFGFCSGGARPALYYFKRNEPVKQLPGRFEIEPQIFCNLLHRPGAIELRGELRLIRSQLQLLHTIEPFSCESRNGRRIEPCRLVQVLDKSQRFQ